MDFSYKPFYIPTPVVCGGQITNYDEKANYYHVKFSDPYATMGSVACSLIYSPGSKLNYKVGDRVRVLATMSFGGVEMNYLSVMQNAKHYILGYLDKNVMFPVETNKPFFMKDKDLVYFNKENSAGVIAAGDGSVSLTTKGAIKTLMKPYGNGMQENVKHDTYQNYHRVISHNKSYLSKEYFGLYKGKNLEDKITKLAPSDTFFCYKRFLTQTKDPSSWVSTCEGAWNPWVGANNEIDEVKKGSGILYTKIINSGKNAIAKRLTIEAGENGPSFYNFRIDKIVQSEQSTPNGGGCTQALLGNMFKMNVSDDGAVEVRAASSGIPSPLNNFSKFTFKVDDKGNLSIYSKGAITIAHSETDKQTCSIEFDGKGGININALGGLKVNGEPVASATYIDFIIKHSADLYLSSAPGSPSPINPTLLSEFLNLGTTDPKTNGFVTKGIPIVPTIAGLQTDVDKHATTA